MKHVTPTPNPNGRAEIPAYLGANRRAAARAARTQTEFLPDPSFRSLRAIYFALDRFQMGGLPLGRSWALLLPLLQSGRQVSCPPAGPGQHCSCRRLPHTSPMPSSSARRSFVAFESDHLTEVAPASLAPGDKIAVYITRSTQRRGLYRRFTFTAKRSTVLSPPACPARTCAQTQPVEPLAACRDEIGMYCTFILPDQIQQIER